MGTVGEQHSFVPGPTRHISQCRVQTDSPPTHTPGIGAVLIRSTSQTELPLIALSPAAIAGVGSTPERASIVVTSNRYPQPSTATGNDELVEVIQRFHSLSRIRWLNSFHCNFVQQNNEKYNCEKDLKEPKMTTPVKIFVTGDQRPSTEKISRLILSI